MEKYLLVIHSDQSHLSFTLVGVRRTHIRVRWLPRCHRVSIYFEQDGTFAEQAMKRRFMARRKAFLVIDGVFHHSMNNWVWITTIQIFFVPDILHDKWASPFSFSNVHRTVYDILQMPRSTILLERIPALQSILCSFW